MRCYSQIYVKRGDQWVEPCGSDQECPIDGRRSAYNKQAEANAHAERYAKFHGIQAIAKVKYRR